MRVIVDSSAWIEYLEGTSAGEKVKDIISGENEILILDAIVAEVISFVKRNKKDVEIAYKTLISNAKIINIKPKMAKEAGFFHAERREKVGNLGLTDSFIYTAAKEMDAKILTKDYHFKNFKEVILIK